MKLSSTLLLTLPLAATSAFAQFVYTGGHADFGVALENGTDFHLHVHTHTGAVIDGIPQVADDEYDADTITTVVPGFSTLVPGANIPAAGVSAGDTIWTLPQSNPNTDTIPFLGIGTEELVSTNWTGNILFTLGAVTSPSGSGTFSLSQSNGLGLDFIFSSADAGLTIANNVLSVAAGGHDHYNWFFNETGLWTVEMNVSGVHNSLGSLSDTQTFAFSVVPEPSTVGLLIGGSMLAFVLVRRRS